MTERFDEFETDLEEQPTFEDALEELKTDDESLPSPALIVGLSALSDSHLAELAPVWDGLGDKYRHVLMQMLVDANLSNFELDYNAIGYATLYASQADVRQAAIELLWEDESVHLLRELLTIALEDEAFTVRAEATKALGRFVLKGELGKLADDAIEATQNTLFNIIGNADEESEVRRFAIESISNCTRDGIPEIIETAYASPDPNMRLSAIIAMGRSCDEKWENKVLAELESHDDDMRIAAIRSAGEIQLETATGQIIKNIENGDREEQEIAIWSLGELGGKEAIRTLESLLAGAEDAGDVELTELIDDAIGNASLVNGELMMLDIGDLDN